MGSYASQLDIKQRWQVIAYIKKTQAGNGGDPFTMGASANGAVTAMATDTTLIAPVAEPAKAEKH
jgi:hypothetical protein